MSEFSANVVTPTTKREAVTHLCSERGVSERRAFKALQFDRSSVRYKSIRGDDADIHEAMRRLLMSVGGLAIGVFTSW